MIRAMRPEDVPAVLRLIHELAAYEREPAAVFNDEPSLHAALFGAAPAVFAHIAQDEGAVVGVAIWFVNYSTWTGRHGIYLEDLIVSAEHRSGGYGRGLISELARICIEREYARLEWTVLDWNEPALGFYRRLGAEPMNGWTMHRLSGPCLADVAKLA